MEPNIGLEKENRNEIAKGLSKFLADTFALYLKTLNYHWNVTGKKFRDLHLTFEEQYTELATAIDEIAERITILGYPAPGSFSEYLKIAEIKDAQGVPDAQDMIKDLLSDNEIIVRNARKLASKASDSGDEGTLGLLANRMTIHEKTAWMLRSKLD